MKTEFDFVTFGDLKFIVFIKDGRRDYFLIDRIKRISDDPIRKELHIFIQEESYGFKLEGEVREAFLNNLT